MIFVSQIASFVGLGPQDKTAEQSLVRVLVSGLLVMVRENLSSVFPTRSDTNMHQFFRNME